MEEEKDLTNETPVEDTKEETKKVSNKKSPVGIIVILLIIIAALVGTIIYLNGDKKESNEGDKEDTKTKEVEKKEQYSPYRIVGSDLQEFDLYFLQLENEEKNKVYSPLSIKYSLSMLEDAANGDTKTQIENVKGTYTSKKYVNSKNMSFANALFIRDSYKSNVKDTYINTLKDKYDAEVIYDSFKTPNTLNNWISNKTFKLIKNMVDDLSTQDFVLANALAIDMEWVKKIQSEDEQYQVTFPHRNFSTVLMPLDVNGYGNIKFNNKKTTAKTASIDSVVNRYDIINEVGEDNIRKTVTADYTKWLKNGAEGSCDPGKDPDAKTYVEKYIKEISGDYKHMSSSTDFMFYVDENVKAFAKDLKTYNGTTLQYVGIMPIKDNLATYIKNSKASDINTIISNLKDFNNIENFKDKTITHVYGDIPMFNFEYELDLMNDLNKLGITDVFNAEKADLSNLTTGKAYINDVKHKTNIEFSNDGIKAAAAVTVGGAGMGGCGYDYIYKVPVEEINLTFDNPYVFFVRDKDTGEVWFTGTVYEPVKK